VIEKFEMDETGRIERMKVLRTAPGKDEETLQDLKYSYDSQGNVTKTNDRGNPSGSKTPPSAVSSYFYDGLNCLVEASGFETPGIKEMIGKENGGTAKHLTGLSPDSLKDLETFTQKFSYDTGGNLTSVSHSAAGIESLRKFAVSDKCNHVLSVIDSRKDPKTGVFKNIGSEKYAYNPAGCMTLMPDVIKAFWNDKSEMIEAETKKGGPTQKSLYDSTGARRIKTVDAADGSRTETLSLNGYVETRTGKGGVLPTTARESRLYGPVILTGAPDPKSAKPILAFGDSIGSVRLRIGDKGEVLSLEQYYPYGGTSLFFGLSEKQADKRRRYSNEVKDKETQTYYYGARNYSPLLSRWTSPDPAGTVDGLNLFAMVTGNPVTLKDINGLGFGDWYRCRNCNECEQWRLGEANAPFYCIRCGTPGMRRIVPPGGADAGPRWSHSPSATAPAHEG